jgi:2-polyprenyl-3-methyl-5-hydroxy-6-metoxy-1,4-benzoquinol methylase
MATQPRAQQGQLPSYTDNELALTSVQSALLETATRDILVRAGIQAGMRVLDFGCGIGDVALLAASLVGPGGTVIGIDIDPRAIHCSRNRAGSLPVRFEITGLDRVAETESLAMPFDAVVSRCVLCHQPDPVVTVRKLASLLRPGGLLALMEPEIDYGISPSADLPETKRCMRLIRETVRKAGIPTTLGTQLPRIFHESGLSWPDTSAHIVMGSGPDFLGYDHIAHTVGFLLPLAERFGLAAFAKVELEGLADRIRHEVVANRSSLITHIVVGAWTRRMGASPDMTAFR